MECCANTLSRDAFLKTKLANFHAYLKAQCDTPAKEATLAQLRFDDLDAVRPYFFQAASLRAVGALDSALDSLYQQFGVSDAQVKAKIGRYVAMFCDVLTS